jgi:hypothetical protein
MHDDCILSFHLACSRDTTFLARTAQHVLEHCAQPDKAGPHHSPSFDSLQSHPGEAQPGPMLQRTRAKVRTCWHGYALQGSTRNSAYMDCNSNWHAAETSSYTTIQACPLLCQPHDFQKEHISLQTGRQMISRAHAEQTLACISLRPEIGTSHQQAHDKGDEC